MENRHWPELNYSEAKETYQTIHLWSQIVGKIKLGLLPWINHSWHVALLLTPHGLTTGDLPAPGKHFQIDLDFIHHQLRVQTSQGEKREINLASLSVAACYTELLALLKALDIEVTIYPIPSEMKDPTPFPEDEQHATYNPTHATNLHTAMLSASKVFTQFRSEFSGKCSPVHFFWGSYDLAVTRFSGREAPPHPGGIPNLPDWVAREAYSQEVSSCGFWPGSEALPFAAFYSYMYPEPEGFKQASIKPEAGYYTTDLGEFILPYAAVRQAENPEELLLEFLHSTYTVGADLANWDRARLELQLGK
ncbi:DUF5996 family protein [Pontibacter akesuensis]|uniref:Ava_C0101 and related proteins n=1 Tax=Pontibacter akesuensis TaxID=388950 RepID=A0A1I7K9B4_9BACT|nr:DUF5996 family protein [Pontibacter akesuensis]GHA74099.1 hypothetical protein GCM10007389_29660 [Pontibacter akesuensis]SFU93965.1 hypothetical protein SAMN04487941_3543 [Pontibacter akesuensis]